MARRASPPGPGAREESLVISSNLTAPRGLAGLIAIALAVIALVGCGSSTSTTTVTTTTPHNTTSQPATTGTTTTPSAPSSGHMTAQQVADKLAPLGCTATPASSTIDLGDIKPVTALQCKVNGEDVDIGEYRNAGEVDHNLKLAKDIGCSIAKEAGKSGRFDYVRGSNWLVSPDTNANAEAIKNAIGGDAKIHSLHC